MPEKMSVATLDLPEEAALKLLDGWKNDPVFRKLMESMGIVDITDHDPREDKDEEENN